MRALVSAVMLKSVSEKAFIKNQAIKSLNCMAKKWNYGAM